ncbi:hypothetical protein EKT70_00430 [Stenotrophomonas geniculata]|uniref:hypothetical protein n=1 Tax=Stenotrophomonas geniculata TaxID=86188 RepID=UPI000F833F34|nr:hypothetical protein [Stenotrophomonas geniculata]RTY19541.1 hypothetical protein EKT70_00430 [Stenotrophomonas geniculata]
MKILIGIMTVLAAVKVLDFYLGSGWGRLLGAAGFLVLAVGLIMDGREFFNEHLGGRQVFWRRILIGAIGSALLLADLALRESHQVAA